MADSLIEMARSCPFEKDAIVGLSLDLRAAAMPAIDHALMEAVEAHDDGAFSSLLVAALIAGRPVDARHLEKGAVLLPDPSVLAIASGKCSGDVPGALVAAVSDGNMGWEREANALLIAGICCARAGKPFPPDLAALARTLARKTTDNILVYMQLLALSEVLQDPHLASVLEAVDDPIALRAASALKNSLFRFLDGPVIDVFADEPEPPSPIRREAPAIGRNDPCPCGSGRKYKKCCIGKDRGTLPAPAAPPRTPPARARARATAEEDLHAARLEEMRSYEMVRLEPEKMDPGLLPLLLRRLLLFKEHEAAVRIFERVGIRKEIEGFWDEALMVVSDAFRKDLVERLLRLPGAGARAGDLPISTRILLAPPEATGALDLLEAEARKAVDVDGTSGLIDLSHVLLEGRWPALGILMGRGILPAAASLDQWALLETILETRDRLGLSPDDPVEDVLDRLSIEESRKETGGSKALAEAQGLLAGKAEEARKLREEVAALQARLKGSEGRPPGDPLATGTAERRDDPGIVDLRRRLESLKQDLKERHGERNRLRKDLRKALEEIEALRKDRPAAAAVLSEEDRAEEVLLAGEEDHGPQPVRVPVFPSRFHEALEAAPPLVARTALTLIGRLAAGEPAAFRGARRLEGNREVFRHRVGILHRLLFRLGKDALEVLALIPRRDLERTIRAISR